MTWLLKDRKWGNFLQRDNLDKGECYPSETDSFFWNEQHENKAEESEVSIIAAFYLFTVFFCVVKGYCAHYYWANNRHTKVKTEIKKIGHTSYSKSVPSEDLFSIVPLLLIIKKKAFRSHINNGFF